MMQHSNPSKRGYILAAVAGALGGGIAIMLVTKAIPRLVSQIMNEMMSKMPRSHDGAYEKRRIRSGRDVHANEEDVR